VSGLAPFQIKNDNAAGSSFDQGAVAAGQAFRASARPRVAPILLGLSLWFLLAGVLGASGQVARLHPPGPQLVLATLTILAILVATTVPSVRALIFALDLRTFVALHLTRVVGLAFLVLYGRGELPFAFAVYGGWGDILVATLAGVLLIAVGPPVTPGRRRLYGGWNALGLADILGVVATAARLGLADPSSMAALGRFPLSLLPTFLVPLIIVTHVLLVVRLVRLSRGGRIRSRDQAG
jgi:hypothetical protein